MFFNKKKEVTPEERRNNTIEKLKKLGIDFNPNLSFVESKEQVKVKDIATVKKRAMASLLSIQLACSIRNGEDYKKSVDIILEYMQKFGILLEDLLPKERLLIENSKTKEGCQNELTMQDVTDVGWTYEAYWSIVWALDLITDKELSDASKICNGERAIALMSIVANPTGHLRDTDKLLDMLDLFYCYHWACVNKRIDPNTKIGNLNPEVVWERRRGLEWLISEEKDWFDISLDT